MLTMTRLIDPLVAMRYLTWVMIATSAIMLVWIAVLILKIAMLRLSNALLRLCSRVTDKATCTRDMYLARNLFIVAVLISALGRPINWKKFRRDIMAMNELIKGLEVLWAMH